MTGRRIVRRGTAPVVWVLAAGWVALTGVGRGIGHAHDWYEALWSATGRLAVRAGRAVLRRLGPLGRELLRLGRPVLRALRRAWDAIGRRLRLWLVRPLGRMRRWLVDHVEPIAGRVVQWGRRIALRVEPVTRALAYGIGTVERAGTRLRLALRTAWAPAAGAVRRVTDAWSARRP
jgi:hypothetical protein